ncbi:MAG: DMT family transporter, partial [Actinomycetota bacterium]|nr:DMT family transporter [Actinomycetota bacterium]
AGAFVNLEPVVGAAAGWLAFGGSTTIGQLTGALAVLAGIALSTLLPTEDAEEDRSPTEVSCASISISRASSAPISDKDSASRAQRALARHLRDPPGANHRRPRAALRAAARASLGQLREARVPEPLRVGW